MAIARDLSSCHRAFPVRATKRLKSRDSPSILSLSSSSASHPPPADPTSTDSPMDVESRFLLDMQTAGIRITIVQDGLVMLQADTCTKSAYDESRDAEMRYSSSRRHMRDRGSSSSNRIHSLYIDTDRPFTILMYQHKTARSKAFWHTETLDGRTRMGNALDRSPLGPKQVAQTFPFPEDSEDSKTAGRRHKRYMSFDACQDTLENDGWSLCGQLPQKTDKSAGHYKLRLSPSLISTKDDLTFECFYKDIHRKSAELRTPQPTSPAQSISYPKRALSVSSDSDVIGRDLSCDAITPVSRRISAMTLQPSVSLWDSSTKEIHLERSRSVPLVDSLSPEKLSGHKRGIDQVCIPRSCTSSMINEEKDVRLSVKRQCVTTTVSILDVETAGPFNSVAKQLLPSFGIVSERTGP